MFAMLSLADDCFVSVHFDAASFAEPETFAQCLRQAFAAVLGRGGPSAALDGPVLDHAPASRRVTRPARAGDGKVAARGGRAPRVRTRTQRT
jgi:hypothetical protein